MYVWVCMRAYWLHHLWIGCCGAGDTKKLQFKSVQLVSLFRVIIFFGHRYPGDQPRDCACHCAARASTFMKGPVTHSWLDLHVNPEPSQCWCQEKQAPTCMDCACHFAARASTFMKGPGTRSWPDLHASSEPSQCLCQEKQAPSRMCEGGYTSS